MKVRKTWTVAQNLGGVRDRDQSHEYVRVDPEVLLVLGEKKVNWPHGPVHQLQCFKVQEGEKAENSKKRAYPSAK